MTVGFGSRREVVEVVERFPAGGRVKVYYDPKKPGSSTARPGKRAAGSFPTGFLLTIVFVFFVGLYFLLFVR